MTEAAWVIVWPECCCVDEQTVLLKTTIVRISRYGKLLVPVPTRRTKSECLEGGRACEIAGTGIRRGVKLNGRSLR